MRISITKLFIISICVVLSSLSSCALENNVEAGNFVEECCHNRFKFEEIKDALVKYVAAKSNGMEKCNYKKLDKKDILKIGYDDNENVIRHFKDDLVLAGFNDLSVNSFESFSVAVNDLCSSFDNTIFFIFIVVDKEIHIISDFDVS